MPGSLPDSMWMSLRRMVRRMPGSSPNGLRVSLQCMVQDGPDG